MVFFVPDNSNNPLEGANTADINWKWVVEAMRRTAPFGFDPTIVSAMVNSLLDVQAEDVLIGVSTKRWPEHPVFKRIGIDVDFYRTCEMTRQTLVYLWPEARQRDSACPMAIPILRDARVIETAMTKFVEGNSLNKYTFQAGIIDIEVRDKVDWGLLFRKHWDQISPEVAFTFQFNSENYPDLRLKFTTRPFPGLLRSPHYDFSKIKHAFLVVEYLPPEPSHQMPIIYTEMAELIADLTALPRTFD